MRANDEAETFQPLGKAIKPEQPQPAPLKPEQIRPGIVRNGDGTLGTNIPVPPL